MTWEVGQKVICTARASAWADEKIFNPPHKAIQPVKGYIYTIIGFNENRNGWFWKEKPNDFTSKVSLGLILAELPYSRGFDDRAFRPIDDSDIKQTVAADTESVG